MPNTAKIDLKIKRLIAIETDYRAEIKHAQAALREEPERKVKYARVIAKCERKVEKLLPKIRRLRELRARIRGNV